ncbi:hypothetical protein PM082_004847 [Marasmius tenuissimus]|nr:hypothetical protein PM082_004847 [Marasmius tenuissimus]
MADANGFVLEVSQDWVQGQTPLRPHRCRRIRFRYQHFGESHRQVLLGVSVGRSTINVCETSSLFIPQSSILPSSLSS